MGLKNTKTTSRTSRAPACDDALSGRCCSCGYDGEEDMPCPKREDGTHCDHRRDGPNDRRPGETRDRTRWSLGAVQTLLRDLC